MRTVSDEPRAPSFARRTCAACQASVPLDEATSYVWWDDAWFCPRCWRGLSAEQIAYVVREVALRGVPLS